MVQPLDPPYRATGYRYTYRTYVSQGIAGYRAIPPEIGPYRSRGERVAGGIAAQAALGRVSRYRGVSLR